MMGPVTFALVGRFVASLAAILAATRYGFGLYAWRTAEALEKPNYTVIQKLSNGVELRKYEPYLIAETSVDKSGISEASPDGFRTCAGYIFGKNKEEEKMAMTAPVRISDSCSYGEEENKQSILDPIKTFFFGDDKKKTKVSFVIGSKYSLSSAPRPLDKKVSLKEVPSHYLAATKFNGPPPSDKRVQKERARIDASLKEANLKAKSGEDTVVYGYHDPFITPNLLRRNEVGVLVENQ